MSETGIDARLVKFHHQYGDVSKLPKPVIIDGLLDEAGRLLPFRNNRIAPNLLNDTCFPNLPAQSHLGVYLDHIQVTGGIGVGTTLVLTIFYEDAEDPTLAASVQITLLVDTSVPNYCYHLNLMARSITGVLSGAGGGNELYVVGSW